MQGFRGDRVGLQFQLYLCDNRNFSIALATEDICHNLAWYIHGVRSSAHRAAST